MCLNSQYQPNKCQLESIDLHILTWLFLYVVDLYIHIYTDDDLMTRMEEQHEILYIIYNLSSD